MRKIKEVLRLKFEVGLGLRQIARSCSIGLGTAREYLERGRSCQDHMALGGLQGTPRKQERGKRSASAAAITSAPTRYFEPGW